MKNLGHCLLAAAVGVGAVWTWVGALSTDDPKWPVVGMFFGLVLAFAAFGIVACSPAVRASQAPRDRWIREVPMGCLVAVSVWTGLFAAMLFLFNSAPPEWVERALEVAWFPATIVLALLVGVLFVVRRARR